ncbi:hypothetical protein [Streptomyces orinoci]|uniref:Uncharacterized protein n=1 Tax=Streptomyces orinoci TaxID=67339 RepID=A0ABV3K2B0_STRON|nr:hypothetical protein [Streptomyces orinoci]
MDDKAESGAKAKGRRLDLSVAQVAGSALAAVVAALLAGKLGVYGTVIGAGVVSVVATTGSTVFHHLFTRTGEQVREATAQAARPRMRRVPVGDAGRAVARSRSAQAQATVPPGAGPDRTRPMPQASERREHSGAYPGVFREEYSEGTLHGTRVRGWKRSLLAAGAVFVLAMGTLTVVELTSGSSADGNGGTTIGQIIRPEKPAGKQREHRPDSGEETPGPERSAGGNGQTDEPATPSPDASRPGQDTGKQTPKPSPTPSSGDTKPSPPPTPGPTGTPDHGKNGGTEGQAGGAAQTPPAGTAGQGSVS